LSVDQVAGQASHVTTPMPIRTMIPRTIRTCLRMTGN
jgi:hypothetical protein